MKIADSSVAMASSYEYSSYRNVTVKSTEGRVSGNGAGYSLFSSGIDTTAAANRIGILQRSQSEETDPQTMIAKLLLEFLRKWGKQNYSITEPIMVSADGTSLEGSTYWTRIETSYASEQYEKEAVAFSTQGTALTEDGREIFFQVDLNLSRELAQKMEWVETADYAVTDPLVIHLSGDFVGLSDQKFFFDLDDDGELDEISYLESGSGFLALDKNGDGIIGDGSELFGTKSGDGFKDLSAYDEDGNGWIDENDDVYDKLKVWVKTADGDNRLLDLKEADVGAIYLGNASTEFSLVSDSNATNGFLRKTGIYLKESSGQAATISHVDFVTGKE